MQTQLDHIDAQMAPEPTPTGELFFSADSEVEDIGEAIVLLQRIEQALAQSGGAGEELEENG